MRYVDYYINGTGQLENFRRYLKPVKVSVKRKIRKRLERLIRDEVHVRLTFPIKSRINNENISNETGKTYYK